MEIEKVKPRSRWQMTKFYAKRIALCAVEAIALEYLRRKAWRDLREQTRQRSVFTTATRSPERPSLRLVK